MASSWRLHTNLYKFGENVSPHIFHKKNCSDLNLGESLCISTFFLFPDSRLNLLKGFDFLFWSFLNGVTVQTSNKDNTFLTTTSSFTIFRLTLAVSCSIFSYKTDGQPPVLSHIFYLFYPSGGERRIRDMYHGWQRFYQGWQSLIDVSHLLLLLI